MNTNEVIRLARKHLGEGNEASARVALADAIALSDRGDLDVAKARALHSLCHSVGVYHPDYLKASR